MRGFIVLMGFLCLPAPVYGALIERDLFASGDGLITLDDGSGLRWLDVNVTQGVLFADVVLGEWYAKGWRHATGGEICGLVASIWSAPGPTCLEAVEATTNIGSENFTNPSDWRAFIVLLGYTHFSAGPQVVYEINGTYVDADGNVRHFGASWRAANNGTFITAHHNFRVSNFPPDYQMGHWLMRAIPEPSTGILVAGGLVVLAFGEPFREHAMCAEINPSRQRRE